MKFNSFNLMAVLVALPAAVQACDLRLEWVSNWSEAALRRYRVTLITTPQDDSQLGIFCDQLGQTSVMASNVQCFWEDGRFLADTSFQEGSVGHGQYLWAFEEAARRYSDISGCGWSADL